MLLGLASCLGAALLGCGSSGSNPLGTVSSTSNPQVAQYTVQTTGEGTVAVSFGKTTAYGLQTGVKYVAAPGGPVTIEVGGMQANTLYHMQALVQYANGETVRDADHTFETGAYDPSLLPAVAATTTPGQTPQSGVEVLNPVNSPIKLLAVDLSGHVIWAYNPGNIGDSAWQAPKLLADGDFIALASIDSSQALAYTPGPGDFNLVREFDLVGNTVKQITMNQLNSALAAKGYNLHLLVFSHDVVVLPNGHWLVLANTSESVVLTGATTPTTVLGDVIVDLDTNLQPVWVWNEFDHLDVNRHPMNFPDWTHTNAVIYSPEDGNLLVSIRHQNWVVKVDYENGAGSGDILWRLGAGGDFTLVGGTDPTDWNYAQHGISFASSYSAGIFPLALVDNGDDRLYPGQTTNLLCGTAGAQPCYTTIPIFDINESAKTATLTFHQILPASLYNAWGGNAEVLANGDVEYDLSAVGNTNSEIFEVTDQPTPQTVWSLKMTGANMYRAYRLPSLYPGVQW
ncbi:MAG TPA: aryl-sulfate sulfotransferase [Acidobacteriaceae bacterium]|jgi:hypothetical protein|nr:aryl-sulfate sulfotransferase [Acidobacteriaceae bacterium]